jgi:hypothetical protein
MGNEIIYQVLIEEETTEPNVIQKLITYKFLKENEAFDFAKIKINDQNVIEIDVIKDDGKFFHPIATFKNVYHEK